MLRLGWKTKSKGMKVWSIQGGEVQVQNLSLENLKSGKRQNPDPAGNTKKTGSQNRTVRECALALLEFRDRTERELRQKLKEREYSAEEINETVLFLKEYRYLDDEAYVDRYIRSCAARKSRRQIRADLERKGVSREIIDLQLQEKTVDEDSQIRKLLQKKGYVPGKRLEPAVYRRIMGALGRRGFSGEAIRKAMESMREELEEFF